MKIKLFFLLIWVAGFVQDDRCDVSFKHTIVCSSCGDFLTIDEIYFNRGIYTAESLFRCQKCQTRGKEEDELALGHSSEEKLQTYMAALGGVSSSVWAETEGTSEPADHFYANPAARKLIDEATWELVLKDKKKPRKIVAANYKKNILLRKKKSKKKKAVPARESGFLFSFSPPSFLHNKWTYTFPQSELGAYFQLQVVHGDHVFTSFSKSPAQELWCQGSRSVVVTEDGYTYFDIEKNERFFFRKKEDLREHIAAQGFDSEFKVSLNDEHPVIQVPGNNDSVLEKIFADYKKSIEETFNRYHPKESGVEEKYTDPVEEVVDKFSIMTAS
jgi:hypothetical protein